MPEIVCCVTGEVKEARPRTDGSPALPPGWKRLGDRTYSPAGWAQTFYVRAVRLPVASVVGGDPEQGWKDLRTALHTSWRQATQVANWALVELAKADCAPLIPGARGPKLPRFSPPDHLYREARARWPDLDSQSVGALLQRVRAHYAQVRFDLRVRAAVTLPTFRYPVPVPVAPREAVLEVDDQHQPFLTVRLAGRWFRLRLRSGPEFRRQVVALERVGRGEALQGETLLYEQAVGGGHRNGGETRRQPGANRRPTRVMAAVSIWLPKDKGEQKGEARQLVVRTGPERLWTVVLEGREEPWNLNEDQVRRWVAEHTGRLQRLTEDAKFEQRVPRRARVGLNGLRERLCNRHRHRLDDFCHKASALLAGLARRNRVGVVEYDDADHSWLPTFPWFRLRTMVGQKLDALGIRFVVSGSSEQHDEGSPGLEPAPGL